MNNNVLTIIVPCYNEEAVLPETVKELTAILKGLIDDEKVAANSKILFVNDGSKDQTWSLISQYSKENELVTGLKFSRNYGHQNALLAGMSVAVKYSDMMITIDADLQDDVNAILRWWKSTVKDTTSYTVYGIAGRPIPFSSGGQP